jgi:ketosteroid isomerase-like protein
MSVEENKEIVRRAFEALKAGDLSPLGDLLAADAVVHQCGFLEPIPAGAMIGGAVTDNLFSWGGRIPDRQVRIERLIGEGDLVALRWTMAGRISAPEEPEIDGRTVSVPWMTFARLAHGKIAELWNIRDTSTLETQLRETAGIS